jgi:glycogen debranching enzyme
MNFIEMLKNRIDLAEVPFCERGSRMMLFRSGNTFSIRLAERWLKVSRRLTAYRDRPALIDQLMFTDEAGNPLELEITTYPHVIEAMTTLGKISLVFIDEETLLLSLPPCTIGITFQTRVDKAQADRRGGILRLTGKIRRNIAYTTDGQILRNSVEPHGEEVQMVNILLESSGGCCMVMNITPKLGFRRYIPDAEAVLQVSARRWNDWFAAAPAVAEQYSTQYYFAWWVMRAGLISPRFYITREAMAPSKIRYVGIWQWDAYFHSLAYRHVDKELARNQIRIFLDHQREDGMLPDAVHDEGVVTHLPYPVDADVSKPPLAAWATWKLHRNDPDAEFLNEVYEPLTRCINWWFEKNDLDGNGLCEYQHPYSSGLDDSPLFDDGMPVESPDLNSYLTLEMEALSQIAQVIGLPEQAIYWSERASELVRRMIESEWDPEAGLFWAKKDGVRISARTPFNLFPLITGRLPTEISTRLVAHLTNPHEFWPRYPVPSTALDDPAFRPNRMWRGPTWVNVNYLLIEGLWRSGFPEVARELRRSTLDMINARPDIYEYYHPETGTKPSEAATVFGWSSAIFIDLAIQDARDEQSPSESLEQIHNAIE